jgi:hypothetical protein
MSKDFELWLYGSNARGDVDVISDFDLLLVADSEISPRDIPPEKRDLLTFGSVSRYDWKEVEGMAKYGSLFLHHIRLEGRCLGSSSTSVLSLRTILSQLPPYQRVKSDLRAFQTTVDDIRQSLKAGGSLWSPEQIICGSHMQAREDRCHDAEHALSTLVHQDRIAVSLFVRYMQKTSEPPLTGGINLTKCDPAALLGMPTAWPQRLLVL